MSPFTKKVIEIVRLIPAGKVVSYGQIALYIGSPRAARQVGWILRQIGADTSIPWWRVVNQKGRISIKGNFNADRELQKKLLESEGVEITDFSVDMGKYKFVAGSHFLKKLHLEEKNIDKIVSTYYL
jgi:methylated-DNA-protein-cysteine methyltransferase related protein